MPQRYIPQLTFPRFLAAIIVVVFHYGKQAAPFEGDYFGVIKDHGHIAVSFFFFLSGAILAINYYDKEVLPFKSFMIKRTARIYPLYLLAFIITFVLMMMVYDAFPKGSSIILQALTLQAWVPGIALEINYPGWSISNEMFFYVLFPFLIPLFKKMSSSLQYIVVIGFWAFNLVLHIYFFQWFGDGGTKSEEFVMAFPLWHLNGFLFGIMCGLFILNRRDKQNNLWLARLAYVIGVLGIYSILFVPNMLQAYTHNGLLSPFYFLIIAGLSLDTSWLMKLISKRIPVLLGEASYGMYMLQFPVYIVFSYLIGVQELTTLQFYMYLLILIVVSIVVYYAFETTMRRKIQQKFLSRN